jgi:hypothetical protein
LDVIAPTLAPELRNAAAAPAKSNPREIVGTFGRYACAQVCGNRVGQR